MFREAFKTIWLITVLIIKRTPVWLIDCYMVIYTKELYSPQKNSILCSRLWIKQLQKWNDLWKRWAIKRQHTAASE